MIWNKVIMIAFEDFETHLDFQILRKEYRVMIMYDIIFQVDGIL